MRREQKRPPASGTGQAVQPRPGRIWSSALLSLFLVLLTLGVFLGVARNGYVTYDDPDYVTSNPQVQRGLTWEGVQWAFRTGHSGNWHPLTWLSHMLDCQLFGSRPGSAHMASLGLHVINALLLFGFLTRTTGFIWRSWMVAALFAVHPLHVESVAWISERKDVLSTLFFLLTLAAYARYVSASGTRKWVTYGLALAFFTLGLMSKPMLVTLPFVLLLVDFWPLRRIPMASSRASSFSWLPSVQSGLLLEKTPFFLLSVVSCVVTYLVQKAGGAVDVNVTLLDRVANALVSYARYLQKTIWPLDLAFFYPHPGAWPAATVLLAAVVLTTITVVAFRSRASRPYLLFGWLWYLGILVPVIGFVQVGMQSMADRYTYVPLVGVFVGLVWLSAERLERAPSGGPAQIVLGAAVLVVCGVLTIRQVGFWRESETLFAHAVVATKGNFLAYNNLGYCYGLQGRGEEEMENYRQSLAMNPEYPEALNNMGCALSARKRYAEALPYFRSALRGTSKDPEIHKNLGHALSELGALDDAIAEYEKSLKDNADDGETHTKLGIVLARKGQLDAAIAHFRVALKINRADATAHASLGNVYALQRHWDDAIREYDEALRLQPNDAQAHYNLANVLVQNRRLTEACAHYREASRLQPEDPDMPYRLALALLQQGDRAGAEEALRSVLRLNPAHQEATRRLQSLQPARNATK